MLFVEYPIWRPYEDKTFVKALQMDFTGKTLVTHEIGLNRVGQCLLNGKFGVLRQDKFVV